MKKILFALSLLISFSAFAENQIDLTTQVKGVLPSAHGGINQASVAITGGSITISNTSLGAPAQSGSIAYHSYNGTQIWPKTGLGFDAALVNAVNSQYVWKVPTGTNNVVFDGTISGNGTGLTGTAAGLSIGGSAANQAITYTSSVTPLPSAGGAYTASHSLGVVPASAWLEITCITAEGGYSVGDVVQTWAIWNGSVFIASPLWKSATQVGIPIGAGGELYVSNKSTAVGFTPTPANWSYRFALRRY